MSLVARLSINDEVPFAYLSIRRITGTSEPNSRNIYEWQIDHTGGPLAGVSTSGTVEHLYGEGAVVLLAKAADAAAGHPIAANPDEWIPG